MFGWVIAIMLVVGGIGVACFVLGFIIRAGRATMNVIDRNDPKSPRYRE